MSSFYCPTCQKPIQDSPGKGYITGCPHFPLENKAEVQVPQFLKDLFSIK